MKFLENGKLCYNHVITVKGNSEVLLYAAKELQKYLEMITKNSIKILTETDTKTAIICVSEDDTLKNEEYKIVTKGENIFISGNNRGVLYGVYSFLEDYFGVKYFTPTVEVVPNKENITLPNIDKSYAPFMEYREPFITEMQVANFAAKSKANGRAPELSKEHGGKVTYAEGYFVHTFTKLFPIEEYFDEHPEYYALIDGVRQKEKTQLCLTNKDVLRLTIEKVKTLIKNNPDAKIISVSQDDNYNGCTCEHCRKIDEYEETCAGSLIYFVNEIAVALEEEYPHIIIDTLAYQYTRKPLKHTKVHKQVCVRLCTIECCFVHPLRDCHIDDPDSPKIAFSNSFSEDLIGWGKISERLYIWDYVTNFSHYWMPHPNFMVLSDNIKFFAENNVRGVFEQGCPAKGGGEMTDLRGYILAKCLYDNNYDANKAMDEFLAGVYGVAGYQIKKYINTVYNYVIEKNCHLYCFNHPDKVWHTKELVDECQAIFDEALILAENEDIYKRIRKQALAVDYLRILLTEKLSDERATLLCEFEENAKLFGLTNIWEREDIDFCLAVLKGEKEPGFWWAK